MITPDGFFQTNKKLFVTVHRKNACKMVFSHNSWLLFLDKSQSYVVVFEIIAFRVYNILVTK